MMGFLKACANTKAQPVDQSSACTALLKPTRRGRPYEPQNIAEAYWVEVKGDQSLDEAKANQFTLNKARRAMGEKDDQALKAIEDFSLAGTPYYRTYRIEPDYYDFDKAALSLMLGDKYTPAIRLGSSNAFLASSDKATEPGLTIDIPLTEEKAGDFFGNHAYRDVIIKLTLDDFIEIGNYGRYKAAVVPKKIDIYDAKTGQWLFGQ